MSLDANKQLRRDADKILLQKYDDGPIEHFEFDIVFADESDGWGDVDASYLAWLVHSGRRWRGPRDVCSDPHAQPPEVARSYPPEYWPEECARILPRFEPQQRSALHAVGRLPLFQTLTFHGGKMVDSRYRPLTAGDFVPEGGLGDLLLSVAEDPRYQDGPLRVISYPVEPSEAHPNGVVDIGFHDHEGNPLVQVMDLANHLRERTFLDGSDCVAFLLCNRTPNPPWIRAVIDEGRSMISLELRDPERTTSKDVQRFYTQLHKALYGPGVMVSFVREHKAAGFTWPEMHALWRERYPASPYTAYTGWQSMECAFRSRLATEARLKRRSVAEG